MCVLAVREGSLATSVESFYDEGTDMPVTNPFRAALLAACLTAVALLATTATASAAAACPGAGSKKLSKGTAGIVVFCLVNHERTKRGLPALKPNFRLGKVARVHAGDMVRYRFLGHNSPARGGLVRRVKRSGFGRGRGFSVGEILAYGSGRYSRPGWIVRQWMKRPIHRKAILFPSFRVMGVGLARGMPTRKRAGRSFVVTFAS